MRRLLGITLIGVAAALSSGCSMQSTMNFSEMQALMPPPPPDKARIFFYRESSWMGNLITPDITLNDAAVGVSNPGGFFFVDREPGDYFVSCGPEADANTSFTAKAGEIVYVRTAFAGGIVKARMQATTVEPPVAIPAIHELKYFAMK